MNASPMQTRHWDVNRCFRERSETPRQQSCVGFFRQLPGPTVSPYGFSSLQHFLNAYRRPTDGMSRNSCSPPTTSGRYPSHVPHTARPLAGDAFFCSHCLAHWEHDAVARMAETRDGKENGYEAAEDELPTTTYQGEYQYSFAQWRAEDNIDGPRGSVNTNPAPLCQSPYHSDCSKGVLLQPAVCTRIPTSGSSTFWVYQQQGAYSLSTRVAEHGCTNSTCGRLTKHNSNAIPPNQVYKASVHEGPMHQLERNNLQNTQEASLYCHQTCVLHQSLSELCQPSSNNFRVSKGSDAVKNVSNDLFTSGYPDVVSSLSTVASMSPRFAVQNGAECHRPTDHAPSSASCAINLRYMEVDRRFDSQLGSRSTTEEENKTEYETKNILRDPERSQRNYPSAEVYRSVASDRWRYGVSAFSAVFLLTAGTYFIADGALHLLYYTQKNVARTGTSIAINPNPGDPALHRATVVSERLTVVYAAVLWGILFLGLGTLLLVYSIRLHIRAKTRQRHVNNRCALPRSSTLSIVEDKPVPTQNQRSVRYAESGTGAKDICNPAHLKCQPQVQPSLKASWENGAPLVMKKALPQNVVTSERHAQTRRHRTQLLGRLFIRQSNKRRFIRYNKNANDAKSIGDSVFGRPPELENTARRIPQSPHNVFCETDNRECAKPRRLQTPTKMAFWSGNLAGVPHAEAHSGNSSLKTHSDHLVSRKTCELNPRVTICTDVAGVAPSLLSATKPTFISPVVTVLI